MDKGAKTRTVGQRADFSTNGAGTTGHPQARELTGQAVDPSLTACTKTNSKMSELGLSWLSSG